MQNSEFLNSVTKKAAIDVLGVIQKHELTQDEIFEILTALICVTSSQYKLNLNHTPRTKAETVDVIKKFHIMLMDRATQYCNNGFEETQSRKSVLVANL